MSAQPIAEITLTKLQRAAQSGALYLLYQPKLDLRTGAITGVEALARWQHARHGAISPDDFIPVIEQNDLMDWFSEWALTTAATDWAGWQAQGLDLGLAVNISALNLKHLWFPDLVERICAEKGVPPEKLILELTEGCTQEAIRLMDTVSRFRLKKIGISLDDFGTGFASLVHLRALPFTELKIDRTFVSDLLVSQDSRAIARGLIRMAHDLGLSVTAEGVEDHETLLTLQTLGCDTAQGFLIGRPMPAEQLRLWMARTAPKWSYDSPGDPAPAAAAGHG